MRTLRFLLLLLGPLQGFLSQTIQISQIPIIQAMKGSSVTLQCDYTINSEQKATIGSYMWYKHSIQPKFEILNSKNGFADRIDKVNTEEFIIEQSAAIVVHSVKLSDSAIYYCEVSFQIGREIYAHGNGTFLNVTGSEDESGNDPNCSCANFSQMQHKICILWKTLGLALILLTAFVGYLCNKIIHSPHNGNSGVTSP